ncbi:hypothetical protein CAPTEDRAFT_171798 [Capitella teleta]|uniref:Cytoplasmic phosphatidylinositol transfer protein 1 n=1 Tax=Capitella teleta TaxID=283909 RepID=R7TV16_CAPTE|nr:hypothetical protein CAPTEDRAFT_171798 [Capitella teleta]|eukprot:ELT97422.1 hypothetical protein CAPTEDRAFT_171798 [Capitella teleta]
MLLKEYRICMPLTVDEYRIGQLYMITKHSHEQSSQGEGVEVVKNEPIDHPEHGKGQLTEKRIYLSSRLPSWVASFVPNIFYITERAENYYPYTITEYTCSFVPRFSIHIETRYKNDNGCTENCMKLDEEELSTREVDFVDIAHDEFPEKHYKEEEDVLKFKSKKTQRGPLLEKDWKEKTDPIMCSYKVVRVKFEVWGLQTRVEAFSHRAIRDVLLVGHRQAFAWIDEWFGMNMDDIRMYEKEMHEVTNKKVGAAELQASGAESPSTPNNTPTDSSLEKQMQKVSVSEES